MDSSRASSKHTYCMEYLSSNNDMIPTHVATKIEEDAKLLYRTVLRCNKPEIKHRQHAA